jgi:hypothetical protein
MATNNCGKVCVLDRLEAENLVLQKIKPDCSAHRHISAARARQVTTEFRSKTDKGFFSDGRDAQWVGPHHIFIERAYAWMLWGGVMQLRPDMAALVPHTVNRYRSFSGTRNGKVRVLSHDPVQV